MNTLFDELRHDPDMQDYEYRHAWAESHLNSMVALQIRVLRDQREWTQAELAEKAEMAQSRISLLEDLNYSAWSISTLKRLAKAYDVRLKVIFEEFGSLQAELSDSDPRALERLPFTEDSNFNEGDSTAEAAFTYSEPSATDSAIQSNIAGSTDNAQLVAPRMDRNKYMDLKKLKEKEVTIVIPSPKQTQAA